jgi:LuxR family maltose regulon positive regulatory protein
VGTTRSNPWAALVSAALPLPADLLLRPRLDRALEERSARRVCTVTGPAGAGKTTAVGAWLASRGGAGPTACLALGGPLSAADDLATALSAALARLGAAEPAPAAGDPARAGRALGLAAAGAAGVLVLDDVQEAGPDARALLAALVQTTPAALRLVLVSRAPPPLPLARLRARGQLDEVAAAALRFDAAETAAWARAAGAALSVEDAARLARATEGWAAGIRLVLDAVRAGADAGTLAGGLDGSWPPLSAYFLDEVLAAQPEPRRELLLRAALLPRLCGPLCDAATGRGGGAAALEALADEHVFTEAAASAPGEFRLHPLFAGALRERFARLRPAHAADARLRAAAWCEGAGWGDEAVELWLAAGAHGRAADALARLVPALFGRGEGARLAAWLDALPPERVRADARLAAGRAWTLFTAGQTTGVERLLRDAEAALAPGDEDGAALVLAVRSQLSLFSRRSADAVVEGASALDRAGGGLRPAVLAGVSVGEIGLGAPEAARRSLDEAATLARRGEGDPALPLVFAAWQCAQAGDLTGCERLYVQARALAEPADGSPRPGAAMVRSGLADVAYERDRLDDALGGAVAAVELARAERNAQAEFTALFTVARALRARGRFADAVAAAREAVRAGHHLAAMLGYAEGLEAECRARAGETEAALAWVRSLPPEAGAPDEFEVIRVARRLSAARVLLRAGRASEAAAWLEPAVPAARSTPGLFSPAVLAAWAAVRADLGDGAVALAAMRDAVRLASRHGHVRSLVDTGTGVAPLVAELLRDPGGEAAAVAAHLPVVQDALVRQRALWEAPDAERLAALAPLDRLTPRELQVLRLLATGLTNDQIASRLGSKPATVKKQLLTVFMKLDARSRTHAVVRGRELGLVQ